MDVQTLEAHKQQLAEIIGHVAWIAFGLPADERPGHIWLSLKRVRDMYAIKAGDPALAQDEHLADHLQKWAEETVRMLEIGRDAGIWHSTWGKSRA